MKICDFILDLPRNTIMIMFMIIALMFEPVIWLFKAGKYEDRKK